MPNPKDGETYITRPHHVESLTNHFRSVKDDVMNTRYYSHYNLKHANKVELKDKELALSLLQQYTDKLKMK